MRAEVRSLHSPDVHNLESWEPSDAQRFGFLLQVLVGPVGGKGEESFDFVVCTPDWLRDQRGVEQIVSGRHHLLVFDYNFASLRRFVEDLVGSARGDSWEELASFLGRYGRWEFEDYRE